MIRWSSIPGRAPMLLIAALCTGTMMTLTAQQPGGDAQRTTPSSSTSTPLLGPRLQAEWPRFEPSVAANNVSNNAALTSAARSHTFVFSTLALVIIGVIVLVLVL
jgi:hypothetical protein